MFSTCHRLLALPIRAALVITTVLALQSLLLAQSALTDDAQTNSTARNAETNFGSKTSLTVSPSGNVYIKFKLSSTLPAGTRNVEVGRATVKLYIANVAAAGKIDVYQVSGGWSESAITFNNAPALGNLLATTAQIDEDKKGTFIVIDVTPAVQQWLGDDGLGTNGAQNHGLVLVPHPIDATTPELANITFDSKENTQTSHEPQLHIAMKKQAGLEAIAHDATLTGDGTSSSPLGMANQSIGTAQLADGGVTNVKLADGTVTENKIADGAISGIKLSDLIISSQKIADGAVTEEKIASGQVLKSLNGLADNVTLQAGSNITITPSGNTLTIAGSGAGPLNHDATLTGDGSSGQPLAIASPLTLTGAGAQPTLSVSRTAGGLAIFANEAIETATQFNIRGQRALTFVGLNSTFVGPGSGQNNTTGVANSFFGALAGRDNTDGYSNSFFGASAGFRTTTGGLNSFFGTSAGQANTTGNSNSFFGASSGVSNITGTANSFFGAHAGSQNSTGFSNSFVGIAAGGSNTTGAENSFFGIGAGASNTVENNNTFIGAHSDGVAGITNATAIGSNTRVTQSNSLVLGNNASVGIGTTAPKAKLHVAGGKLYVEANGQGLILRSPGGTCVEITVTDVGGLSSAIVACP